MHVQTGSDVGLCNLGLCYYRGAGVKKDLKAARAHLEKAADQDNAAALLHLGSMFVKGEGGATDATRGKACWEAAAAKDDGEAGQRAKMHLDTFPGLDEPTGRRIEM